MSYASLSAKLRTITEMLDGHGDELGGKALARSSKSFETQATRFEEKLSDAIKGLTPEMRALEGLIGGPDRKRFTPSAIKLIWKEAHGAAMPSSQAKTPAAAKKNLLASLKQGGSQKKALEKAREIIGKSKIPRSPIPRDEEKLRLELNRLGGLDEDQLVFELETRYSRVSDLKKLANTSGIATPKGMKKSQILSAIIDRARRIHAHTFH